MPSSVKWGHRRHSKRLSINRSIKAQRTAIQFESEINGRRDAWGCVCSLKTLIRISDRRECSDDESTATARKVHAETLVLQSLTLADSVPISSEQSHVDSSTSDFSTHGVTAPLHRLAGIAPLRKATVAMTNAPAESIPNPSSPGDLSPTVAPHFPAVRIGLALGLGALLWTAPFMALNTVLNPARLDQIAPNEKVTLVAVLAIGGSIVASIANILIGALSDRTRSVFGRRAPWILGGSLAAAASLFLLAWSPNVTWFLVSWCLFQLSINGIIAPLVAILADRVPHRSRGTMSAIYGLGILVGACLGSIVGAAFITTPSTGVAILALVVFACGPLVVLLAPDVPSKDLTREPLTLRTLGSTFAFPRRAARDFYLVLGGDLLFMLATAIVSGYQLYILTDYMRATPNQAAEVIALLGGIMLVGGLIFGVLAGPISDRVGRRKVFVVASAITVAAAMLVPFFWAQIWAQIVNGIVTGVAVAVYSSISQALKTEVLPSPDNAAKDLGILNMANTGGQILGPALASTIVISTGGYAVIFPVAAAVLVLSSVLYAKVRKVR